MAVLKFVSLFVVAVLLAAISFSCASAFDSKPHEAALGGRQSFKSRDFINGMKPRNTPAPPGFEPAPGTKTNGEVKIDQPASISIDNNMESGISVHCHSSQQDVPGTIILQSAPGLLITFQEDPAVSIPWICDFSVVGDIATQSFPVVAHDGTPYLGDCDDCLWKVQNDGFWFWSAIHSIYINMHPWIL